VYETTASDALSWYEPTPATSLRLVREEVSPSASVIDVGAGASTLVDGLLASGYDDLTLLDISAKALGEVRARLGSEATKVRFLESDVLSWTPDRTFDLWHDRAVFHFLTEPDARAEYVRIVSGTLAERGVLVLATFAADGPDQCSGLPVARYTERSLADGFPFLALLRSERVEHLTPSGSVQPFIYVAMRR